MSSNSKNTKPSYLTYLIISTIIVLPLVTLQTTIDPVTVPRLILLGLVILIASLAILFQSFRSSDNLVCNPLALGMALAMFGQLMIQIISLSQAINLQEGLLTVIKTLLVVIYFMIFITWLNRDNNNRFLLVRLFSLIGFTLAAIGLCQYFGLGFAWLPGNAVPYGTMANKNLLASAVFLAMFLTIYGCWRLRGAWRKFAMLALAAELLLLIVSNTRAVYLGLGVAIIVVLIAIGFLAFSRSVLAKNPFLRYRRIFRILAIVSVLFMLLLSSFVVYDLNQESASDRLFPKFDYRTLEIRLELWEKSFEMYLDHPMAGVGAGNWKIMIPKYGLTSRSHSTAEKYFQRPHNDFVWVLTETGPVGLIFYLAIFVFGLRYCLRTIKSKDGDTLFSLLMLGFLAGYIGVALFSYPMERVTHSLFLMTCLALIAGGQKSEYLGKSISVSRLRVGAVLAILISGFSLVVCSHRLLFEIHTKRGLAAASIGAWEESVFHLDKAQSPFVNLDPTTTPLSFYHGIAYSSLGLLGKAHTEYKIANQNHPYHLQTLNNLATVYEQKGNHELALEHYKMALQVAPYREQTLVNLAAVYYNIGEYKTAYSYLTGKRSGPPDPRYDYFLKRVSEKLNRQ